MVAILESHRDNASSFKHLSLDEITKEITRFHVKKTCQETDIVTTFIKNNSDIFPDFFFFGISIKFEKCRYNSSTQKDSKPQNPTTHQ